MHHLQEIIRGRICLTEDKTYGRQINTNLLSKRGNRVVGCIDDMLCIKDFLYF